MGKSRNDSAYERGVKDGKEGGIMDDLARNIPIPNITQEDEIYDKGYKYGAEHRYDNSSGSSGSDSSSSGGNSVCYLTTACVDAMGLPDNCLELNVLRGFRDKLLKTPEGRRAVEDYEITAPRIVQAVSEREGSNANLIWRSLYADIKKAVGLVLSGNYEGALQHYKETTLNLKRKYLG